MDESKEVQQFTALVKQTCDWLMEHTERRWCRVCERKTVHVTDSIPGWKRYKCVACGFRESFQEHNEVQHE